MGSFFYDAAFGAIKGQGQLGDGSGSAQAEPGRGSDRAALSPIVVHSPRPKGPNHLTSTRVLSSWMPGAAFPPAAMQCK